MTVTDARRLSSSATDVPDSPPAVVSPTSPLANGFRSRSFSGDDYRRFHEHNPLIVHTFVTRDTPGVFIEQTWDALGVRTTASHDTVFEDARAEAHKTVAVHPVGPNYPDYFGLLLGWYLPLVSNVYVGIARRALDIAILGAQTRSSLRSDVNRLSEKPAVQRQVAQGEIKLEAAVALLESATVAGVGELPPWRALAAKEFATATAREVVDLAVQVVGASSVSKRHELECLYRDVRTGTLHPPNSDAVLEGIGAIALGLA